MTKRKPTAALDDAPVFHPLLFAICPVLGLYAYNVGNLTWAGWIRPAVAAAVASQILLAAFWLGMRDKHKAGIAATASLLALMWGWGVLETGIALAHPWVQAAPPLLVYAVVGGLTAGGAAAAFAFHRANPRRALLYSALFLVAAGTGALLVFFLLERIFGVIASTLFVVYAAALTAGLGVLARQRRDFKPWTRTVNWFGVILVGLYGALILMNAPREARPYPPPLETVSDATGPSETLPDIYVVLLEGYARCDVLLTLYGYNDVPMLESLREHGLRVAGDAFANYAWDVHSATALLNMDYLDNLLPPDTPASVDVAPLIDLYHNNRFFDILRAHGYAITAYSPGVQAFEPRAQVDRCLSPPRSLSEFEVVLLQNTAGRRIMELYAYLKGRDPRTWLLGFRRARAEHVFETIGDVAAEVHESPRLVYAHLSLPDLPFLFERGGGWPDPRLLRPFDERYLNQLHYTSKRTAQAIQEIRARAARPAVVLLVSAHGPGFRGGEDATAPAALAERFGVLLATYYPEGAEPGPDEHVAGASLVNVLRNVLNRVLGTGFPLLEDRAFLTPMDRPLEKQPVTVPVLDVDLLTAIEGR